MIEDLEGATSEPVRRRHVLAVSLATVGFALLLFVALVLTPLQIDQLPTASVPQPPGTAVPSADAETRPTILSSIDQARERVCSYGSGAQWISLAGQTLDGRSVAAYVGTVSEGAAPRSVPNLSEPRPMLWMTVMCSPSDVVPPSIDLRSIPR